MGSIYAIETPYTVQRGTQSNLAQLGDKCQLHLFVKQPPLPLFCFEQETSAEEIISIDRLIRFQSSFLSLLRIGAIESLVGS